MNGEKLWEEQRQIIKELKDENIVKDTTIKRLRKDLKCYGNHSNTCKIIKGGSAYAQCDCGFEQAIKEG